MTRQVKFINIIRQISMARALRYFTLLRKVQYDKIPFRHFVFSKAIKTMGRKKPLKIDKTIKALKSNKSLKKTIKQQKSLKIQQRLLKIIDLKYTPHLRQSPVSSGS